MLSTTKILRYIEAKLGYKFTDLEIDSNEIIQYIKEYTLVTYSKFFPYEQRILVNECEPVKGQENSYYINSELEIIGVAKVLMGNMQYIDPSIVTRGNYTTDVFASIAQNDFFSMVRNPVTFRFYEPNRIEIYPSVMTDINAIIVCNCVHPDHFGTIPMNMQDQFLKLALLDTKDNLYQMRHRFSNLQTVYGNIELFIDDLQDASEKREELLELWRKSAPKGKHRKKLYVI